MRDVHAEEPSGAPLRLQRVGVEGLVKPLAVRRPNRVVTLLARFDVAVDLPARRKGSDLSRNAEALEDVVEATLQTPVESLEAACGAVAGQLLERHRYASAAYVEATAAYVRRRGRPSAETFEEYRLLAEARATRSDDGPPRLRLSVGGEAVGMTACPCAMETARTLLEAEFPLLKDPSLAKLPIVSHNQRNRTRLLLDLPAGASVEADDLLDAIEAAQSAPTASILKRKDEAELVLAAHRNPKFVEDVLRDLLLSLPERFPTLPADARVRATTRSEESIHKYDVVATHETTLGELSATRAP